MTDIVARMKEVTAQLTGPGAPWELVERTIDGVPYRLYRNAPATLKETLDAGRAHGTAEFLIYEGERWTFDEFFAAADALSQQLTQRFGIARGDRVAIAMRNYPEWMVGFVAAASIGAVVVPLNSWGGRDELAYGLEDSGSSCVICDPERLDRIMDRIAPGRLGAVVARAGDRALPEGAESFDALVAEVESPPPPGVDLNADDPALIMYTSGTTGRPKGAVSLHRNICQAIYNFEFAAAAAGMANPETVGKLMEKGFDPKVLLALPLFHVSGCHAVFMPSLRAGRPMVMMYKWDAERALQLIERERITMVNAVPTMLVDLLQSPHFGEYDTASVFGFGAGGAAQPSRLPGLIAERLPDSFPGTGWGMTESNAAGTSSTGATYSYKPHSSGMPTPIVDLTIRDDEDNELPRGEPGHIWMRSPTVVAGYWNKPDKTRETFRDGWLVTGDIGYLDDEDFLFVTDRAKDMIIRGGENIYSAEIEAAIDARGDVQEVAAVGVPHDTLGEELAVIVRPVEGAEITPESIREHVRERLAGFKVPAHVLVRDEPFPRNAALKVLKNQLREEIMESLGERE